MDELDKQILNQTVILGSRDLAEAPFSLAELAQSLSLSESQLLTRFKTREQLLHGGYLWVSLTFSILQIEDYRYVYVVFTDIDDLKEREKELEQDFETAQNFMALSSFDYSLALLCTFSRTYYA